MTVLQHKQPAHNSHPFIDYNARYGPRQQYTARALPWVTRCWATRVYYTTHPSRFHGCLSASHAPHNERCRPMSMCVACRSRDLHRLGLAAEDLALGEVELAREGAAEHRLEERLRLQLGLGAASAIRQMTELG